MEKNLPGVILASRGVFFLKLEKLCSLGCPRVTLEVRNLLILVPSNPRIVQALEVFGPHPGGGGASDDSPSEDVSPQAVLDRLLSTSRMSYTQLLYNLEVLSSCLIPISHPTLSESRSRSTGLDPQREDKENPSLSFRQNFLEHGGLKAVLGVLQQDALPCSMDLHIRQDCYSIALMLARYECRCSGEGGREGEGSLMIEYK